MGAAGNAKKLCELGYEAYEQDDLATAFALFYRAAKLGCAEAKALVGVCLQNGYGVPQDSSEAKLWFARAEQADFPVETLRELLEKPDFE